MVTKPLSLRTVVTANRCHYRPPIGVEALLIDEGGIFFAVLHVTVHERQGE
jgi:hypothetical protein